jgi:hypothetical protein
MSLADFGLLDGYLLPQLVTAPCHSSIPSQR